MHRTRHTMPALTILAVLGMLLASLLTAPGTAAHSTSAYSHDSSTGTTYADWMAGLSDARLLSTLSLPGTHDSGAYAFGGDSVETQSMDIATQLNAGIRVFDIRLGNNFSCPSSSGFYIFHGFVCQFITFQGSVMTPMYNFLNDHPSETVLIRIKPEEGTGDDFASRVATELEPYDARMYKGGSSNPALVDMRGKIVVLQNFGTIGDLAPVTTAISYGAVSWQDNYSMGDNWDLADKWHDVKDQFGDSDALPGNRNQIYGNFLSAAGGGFPYFFASGHSSPQTGAPNLWTGWLDDNVTGSTCGGADQCIDEYPREACVSAIGITTCSVYFEGINILARDYINSSILWRTGIVFADFPGAGLIKAIIDVNSRPVDTTPPTITVPAPMTVEATSAAGATVTFTPAATDTDPANPSVGCAPASGNTFAIATTTVICSATDAMGNTGTASFTITVQDTTAPTFTSVPHPITVNATSPAGAVVSYSITATDLVDGAVTPVCNWPSGSTIPIGTNTVQCTATDQATNVAPASFIVTVIGADGQLDQFSEMVNNTPISGAAATANSIRRNLLAQISLAKMLEGYGADGMACLTLTRLELDIRGQVSRRRIAASDAEALWKKIDEIQAVIGC